MGVPVKVIKLILGTLYALVHAMLKIKNLPEAERQQLEVARDSLCKEILAFDRAERAANQMLAALEREEG